MAFQGFARQEDFSTNQIQIDIGSVIHNDLAEARRISKWHGRNAEFGEKWRGMYLDALMTKHEEEKRNREKNFKFFMENRENIQKQVEYNNKIKAQDAARSHPHVEGLDSILGKGLLKLATNLGSAAIKGAIARSGEAEAEAKKETLEFVKLTSLKASKEQNEMRRNPEFIKRVRSDVEEISKAAIAEYDAAGDHKAGINFAQNVYREQKLDIVDRQNTFNSERLTAIAYQTSLEEFTWNHNGAEITWSDIQAGRYPGSGDAFLDAAEKNFYEERGIHDVGVGAQLSAALGVRSITAQAQRIIKNNQYKRDTKDYEIQLVSTLENHPGTTSEKVQFVTDPNGTHIGSRKTRGEALEWLRNHWENYGSSQQIREAMAASYPGVESINQGAPSARHPAGTKKWQDWNASLAIAVNREEQGRQNTQNEYDGQFNQWTDEANQGLLSPQLARQRLEFFRKGGPMNHRLAGASSQVQTSFMEAMRNAAGYGGEAPTITAGQKAVSDQITDQEAVNDAIQFIKDKKTGEDIAIDGIPTHRWNSLKGSIADTYRYWANGIADDLIASGVRPEDVETEINKIIRTDDPRTDSLKKFLQAEWYHPDNPEVRLKVPNFPNMMKPRGKDEKGFVEEYNADRFAAQKLEQTFGYDDINWNHPVIERWLSQVDRAKRYKHIDLQNALSNAPQAIKRIVNTQKFSSAGQVYQAALDHGVGYGDKYTRLSESDYMDYNEVQQQYNALGSQLSKLDERAKAIITARHAANGGFTLAPHVRREGTLQPRDHFEHGTQGIKNAQGVFANQEVADSAAMVAEAYPNMTWTSTQRTPEYQEDMKKRGYSPSDTSNHLKGISFDAAGPDAQRLRRDIDSGKVQGLDYYIGPGYSHIHFDIIGPVSIAGQQPEPSVVPVSPDSVLAQQFQDYQEGKTDERPEGLPEREVIKEEPRSMMSNFLGAIDAMTGQRTDLDQMGSGNEQQIPDHLKKFNISGKTKSGIAFGELNGQLVRVQPYSMEVIPVSKRTYELLVEEADGPVLPIATLGGNQ